MKKEKKYITDFSVEAIEREIIYRYKSTRCYETNYDYLLSLRRSIINKMVLAHQKDILPDIIAFNDALREALCEMYDRAHRVWKKVIDVMDETDGEGRPERPRAGHGQRGTEGTGGELQHDGSPAGEP